MAFPLGNRNWPATFPKSGELVQWLSRWETGTGQPLSQRVVNWCNAFPDEQKNKRQRDLNSRPSACKAPALPLAPAFS